MAFVLIVLLGFAAFAINISRLVVIRNEMQNAADAAALIGASKLNPTPSGPSDPTWTIAENAARTAIRLNQSDLRSLNDAEATAGYWDITQAIAGLQPKDYASPGPNLKPAVRVIVRFAPGANAGPVTLFLAPIVGVSSSNVTALATAVLAPFGGANPGQVFPVAITKCLYDKYWDSANNRPKLATSTQPLPGTDYPQVIGQPYEFRLGSSYHYDPCASGQWTSFLLDENDVPAVRDLIAHGNPTPFGVGDNIWIEPGTENSLFKAVPRKDVCLPVVISSDLSRKGEAPVYAFAAFRITDSVGGSSKYIQGHFLESLTCGGYGTGPNYGAYAPPRLSE